MTEPPGKTGTPHAAGMSGKSRSLHAAGRTGTPHAAGMSDKFGPLHATDKTGTLQAAGMKATARPDTPLPARPSLHVRRRIRYAIAVSSAFSAAGAVQRGQGTDAAGAVQRGQGTDAAGAVQRGQGTDAAGAVQRVQATGAAGTPPGGTRESWYLWRQPEPPTM
ncbi:hypothetical protein GXP70_23865 [Paenibacillus lycopersici]|uniref:Uncharacterized protein n=1 Tax=Paenibacillus lycopersici TaxID=2704462 RepID=A0A6C0G731_9BACL|nr:hypothetical protein [Paenibacillus lycopersici]QHT62715.1 hypothetical protein GXP70_23865 [Paenibacillus lycopersici]